MRTIRIRSRLVSVLTLVAIAAALSGLAAHTDAADSSRVWAAPAKIVKTLQSEEIFDKHGIQLPADFTESKSDSYSDGSRTQWHGILRADGTRAVISVSIQQLSAEQAAGDPIAYGVKLLQDSGSKGTSKYVATKPELGIDTGTGNWVTRFTDSCVLKSPDGILVPLRSINYVWLDHGSLVMATVYDAASHADESLPQMEASVWTIRLAQ